MPSFKNNCYLVVWLFIGMACQHAPKSAELTSVKLGEKLFFDSTLSRDFSVSCGSCHQPKFAFADTVSVSKGFHERRAKRNTPSLLNVAEQPYFMADGGVKFLTSQPLAPIEDSVEMHFSAPQIVYRLNHLSSYKNDFQEVYQEEPTVKNVLTSLADYMTTLQYESSFEDAVTPGKELFFGKAGCGNCHSGNYLTDYQFYKIIDTKDEGRMRISRKKEDFGKMKTPSLLQVKNTFPYFHDGSVYTLDSAVSLMLEYNQREGRAEYLTKKEQLDLLQFVRSL